MGNSEIEQANDIPYKPEETIISDAHEMLRGNVVIRIEEILKQLPEVNPKSSIYRISKELHELNDNAYTPQFISIGPFHYDTRGDLLANEHYKVQGFISFLQRIDINKKENQGKITTSLLIFLVEKSHGWVKEAYNFYAEPIKMKEEEFVVMMLVDACFIVEFFLLFCYGRFREDGKLFKIDITLYYGAFDKIFIDLIKLENQVPFILLKNLFNLIPKHDSHFVIGDEEEDSSFPSMINLTIEAFKWFGWGSDFEELLYEKEPKHLVDFLSFFFEPPPDYGQDKQEGENNNNNFLNFFGDLLQLCCFWNKKHCPEEMIRGSQSPPSITKLCEAGVTITPGDMNAGLCLIDINFKNGVLKIPRICIQSRVEVMIRNVIAFDHYPAGNDKRSALQYVSFLEKLIETEQDVHLLVKVGVIINLVDGSDKYILEWFKNLSKYTFNQPWFHFLKIGEALREHCNRRRNRTKSYWSKAKVTLKHDYFNTPWAAISVIAASFLIILTLLQTIFSAISAFPG